MLRILSGSLRGRKLRVLPKDPLVRPILVSIRKSLFDIIRPRIRGARFLDIYAGFGVVGIEALSEGVGFSAFIELDSKCAGMIHENLATFGLTDKSAVFRLNATGDLSSVKSAGPFDIIFMGPPYKDAVKTPLLLVQPTLDNISRYGLLAKGGLVVAQHHKKEITATSDQWRLVRLAVYGDSRLSFFQPI